MACNSCRTSSPRSSTRSPTSAPNGAPGSSGSSTTCPRPGATRWRRRHCAARGGCPPIRCSGAWAPKRPTGPSTGGSVTRSRRSSPTMAAPRCCPLQASREEAREMDFTPSEAEVEVSRLAAQVMAARDDAGPAIGADFNTGLWKELGRAGLLSLALPAELGGDDLGVQATAAVLTEAGRQAARIPALATLALGVLPVARSADTALKQRLLAGVASGDAVLTSAIREPSDPMPESPRTVVRLDGSGRPGTVSGLKVGAPYAATASWILIPASIDAEADAGHAGTPRGRRTAVA